MDYGNTATTGPNESNIHFQHNDTITTTNNSNELSDTDDDDFDKQPLIMSRKNKKQPLTLPSSSLTAAASSSSSNKGKGRVTNYQHPHDDATTFVRNKRAKMIGNKSARKKSSICTCNTNN